MPYRFIIPIALVLYFAIKEYRTRKLEKTARRAANWFFWIAGLTLFNSLMLRSGWSLNFVFGLASTQAVDGYSTSPHHVGTALETPMFWMGVAVTGGLILACIEIGRRARRLKHKFFLIGLVAYVLDGLIYLTAPDEPDHVGWAANIVVASMLARGYIACLKLHFRPPERNEDTGETSERGDDG